MSVVRGGPGRLILIAAIAATTLGLVHVVKAYRGSYGLPVVESGTTPFRTITQYAAEIKEARAVLAETASRFPGVSVSVGVGSDVVWSEGAGYADIEDRTQVSASTRFRIYSIAKPITGAAAAALSEQGLLDLDVSVRDYVPSLPEQYSGVTARHLLGHMGGVRHYGSGEWMRVSSGPCATPSDALEAFIEDPLVSAPGESYSYSSYGYVLLSAVIESASGTNFETLVLRQVLRPAWMHNTMIEDPGVTPATTFYEPAWFGRVKEARFVDNTCKWGAGAFLSTADDLVQFCLALLNGRLVSADELDEVFGPMRSASGENTGYAFGWGVGVDDQGRHYASHSGGAIGGRAALYLLREDRVAVAILANMDGERFTEQAARIAGIFAGSRG